MVPKARIELATQGFSVLRSTTELLRPVGGMVRKWQDFGKSERK